MGFDLNNVSKEKLADIDRRIDEQKKLNDEYYKQVTQERIAERKKQIAELERELSCLSE